MERTKSIPAIPYLRVIKQFAFETGLLCFTWRDIMIARRLYEERAIKEN